MVIGSSVSLFEGLPLVVREQLLDLPHISYVDISRSAFSDEIGLRFVSVEMA
jgi:hypothetical protein